MCTILYVLLLSTGDLTFPDALPDAPSVYLDLSFIFDFYTNAGRSFGSKNSSGLCSNYTTLEYSSL
ncbi:hypothetical protein P692DRAFT_20830993 [Suillus brevipes Sb2]|nr:hypothetical protein P692DRAFT_20830993 [Suillus brevipes Sb2]